MRLFVALELPADVRTWLAHRVRPFQETSAVRWVPETNYHLTLAFLGQIAAEQFEPIDSALKTVASGTAVVRTSITGFGSFPGGEVRARVLWAGVDDYAGRLGALAAEVRAALSPWIPGATNPYLSHITLGRCVPPHPVPSGWASTSASGEEFRIEALSLMQSHAQAWPPTYERRHRAPFSA